MSRGKVEVTVDELIATINRSKLPTVVVEGRDDIVAYRKLEDIYRSSSVSVLSAGGRGPALTLYDRKAELKADVSIVFLVDQDTWALSGIPAGYNSNMILYTDGYSIENDALRDFDFTSLMSAAEIGSLHAEINAFLRWYCPALEAHMQDSSKSISDHPERILGKKRNDPSIVQALMALPSAAIEAQIAADVYRLLRGKSLMALVVRHLSYTNRPVRYSSSQLIDMGSNTVGGHIRENFRKVGERLNVPNP